MALGITPPAVRDPTSLPSYRRGGWQAGPRPLVPAPPASGRPARRPGFAEE
jgi:hypothetical protein